MVVTELLPRIPAVLSGPVLPTTASATQRPRGLSRTTQPPPCLFCRLSSFVSRRLSFNSSGASFQKRFYLNHLLRASTRNKTLYFFLFWPFLKFGHLKENALSLIRLSMFFFFLILEKQKSRKMASFERSYWSRGSKNCFKPRERKSPRDRGRLRTKTWANTRNECF